MAKTKPTNKRPTFKLGEAFDPEKIAALLPHMEAKPNSKGNVQVLIRDLASKNDYQVCKDLVEAVETIYKSGLIPDPEGQTKGECPISLSWNTGKSDEDGNQIYKPYPKIWINQPTAQQTQQVQTSNQVEAAADLSKENSKQINHISTVLEKIMMQLQPPTTPVAEDQEVPF